MRRKVRWRLLAPNGEEQRTGLSFGEFDESSAIAHAMKTASPRPGYTLQVFLDGKPIEPAELQAANG